jgi:hypothetical protein
MGLLKERSDHVTERTDADVLANLAIAGVSLTDLAGAAFGGLARDM